MSTKIEWTDETWNPITGCTKISPGCKNCYAERMARRLAGRYGYPEAPRHFDVTLHPDRLEQPLRWKKPRMIFAASMGDLFHKDVPFGFIGKVFATMIAADWHIFQILTKRPKRMLEFISWFQARTALNPRWFRHIWPGVSVENQDQMGRIGELANIPAAVRFVLHEPLLGPISYEAFPIGPRDARYGKSALGLGLIDWVIVGGESGPGARPMCPDWARSIRDQCQAANVPFFFKQHGEWLGFKRDKILRQYIGADGKRLGIHEFVDRPHEIHGDYGIARVGKKRAGCRLDGREMKEWPKLGGGILP